MRSFLLGILLAVVLLKGPYVYAAVQSIQITIYYDDANSAVGYAKDGAAMQSTYWDAAQAKKVHGPFTVRQLCRLAAQNEFVRLREVGKQAKITHADPDNNNDPPQ